MIFTYYFRASGAVPGSNFSGAWDSQTLTTNEPSAQMIVPRDGTFRNLRVLCTSPIINDPIAFTVRLNGIGTPLIVALPAGGSAGSDLVNSIAALAGDLLSIELFGGAAATLPGFANICVDFETADP